MPVAREHEKSTLWPFKVLFGVSFLWFLIPCLFIVKCSSPYVGVIAMTRSTVNRHFAFQLMPKIYCVFFCFLLITIFTSLKSQSLELFLKNFIVPHSLFLKCKTSSELQRRQNYTKKIIKIVSQLHWISISVWLKVYIKGSAGWLVVFFNLLALQLFSPLTLFTLKCFLLQICAK